MDYPTGNWVHRQSDLKLSLDYKVNEGLSTVMDPIFLSLLTEPAKSPGVPLGDYLKISKKSLAVILMQFAVWCWAVSEIRTIMQILDVEGGIIWDQKVK